MNKIKILLLFIFLVALSCFAESEYNVIFGPQIPKIQKTNGIETLFILDYSNSMNEMLANKTKYKILTESIKTILPKISENKIGVRIYGHHWGLTPFDACRATNLIVPIGEDNFYSITENIKKYRPRGMTPITYSLKQAIKNDFKNDKRDKHIILITDGGENCDESPCKYAMELIKYRKDIKIDVIALNLDNQDDLDQLTCTANVTGGKFYHADTEAELINRIENSFQEHKSVNAKLIY
jgi:Ca-activated chloride channel family protein